MGEGNIFSLCVSSHPAEGGYPHRFFFVNFAYGKLQSVQNSNKILLPLNFLKAKVGPLRGLHSNTKLAMLALLPTLYSHIFAVFFFICTN